MEKTISRETAVQLRFRLESMLTFCEQYLPHNLLAESKQLIKKADCELYPALFEPEINLEQSFKDFKNTLSVSIPYGPEDFVPTIDRYDPLDPAATRHATKEINQFIS